jgi:WD40 repeat protein
LVHDTGVDALAVTPDEQFVLTGAADGVHLWQRASASQVWSSLKGRRVTSVAVSSDGKTALAVDSAPGTPGSSVRLWPLDDRPDDLPRLLVDESRELWAAVFAPDDRSLLVLGSDGGSVWSVDGTLEKTFSPHRTVSFAAYAPNMDKVVTAGWDNTIRIWNAQDGRPLRTIVVSKDHKLSDVEARVNTAVFSDDERWILAACEDGLLRLFDAESESDEPVRTYAGHQAGVTFACFMPGGRRILSASRDKTARLWDRDTGEQLSVFEAGGHRLAVLQAAVSPDGRFIATAGEDMQAIVWDAETAQPLLRLGGHTGAVTSVAFSPTDATRLLTGSEDTTAKLWDVQQLFAAPSPATDQPQSEQGGGESGESTPKPAPKELLTLGGHQRGITSVMFSSDGTTALTASRDGTAIIWPSVAWRAQPHE